MGPSSKRTCLVVCLAALFLALAAAASYGNVTEGQVVKVENWTVYFSTGQGEPLAFSPYWVQNGTAWQPKRPALTILPALEAGERVRITWTLDTRENRRRVDNIEVISALEGTSKGTVASANASTLVIKPWEKPGTVTLNTRWVQVEGKWVPDPAISRQISGLKAGTRVTVQWKWDAEGRKRIVAVATGW